MKPLHVTCFTHVKQLIFAEIISLLYRLDSIINIINIEDTSLSLSKKRKIGSKRRDYKNNICNNSSSEIVFETFQHLTSALKLKKKTKASCCVY